MIYYPAVIYPVDAYGFFGVVVPDLLINATGASQDAALIDATVIMQELLADMARDRNPFPEPTQSDQVDLDGGVLVILTAHHAVAAE
ncbi:hypothetical protein [Paracoccus aerodenitrificans]|uniref:hypothetical protein n=1 Tax=Paracoccus aerodenitrificans TaxID=3017781 RepID=UPI0022F128A0|nr:hypothetical protein [Paracoccus aerodenitrificans]WBU63426.1 hypothetical protein PAE61_13830 [Paracoccus aerodenitrificans]